MFYLCVMWAFVEVLGILCLPLTMVVRHNLPDRGWSLSKVLGIAWLAFGSWFPLMSIHILSFSQGYIFALLVLLIAANAICWRAVPNMGGELLAWLRHNFWYALCCEGLFLGMVFLLGCVRSYGPAIQGYEMFMNEGLLASIMRSAHFPPGDMWLSGYSINYYYYSLYILALLAKLLGQTPSIAANTGICTIFGLCTISLFGIGCNLVTWARHLRLRARPGTDATTLSAALSLSLHRAMPYGFCCMLMAMIFGNLAATQDWWQYHDAVPMNFSLIWQAPAFVLYPRTNISEFPSLAFILSCFHAHVLTLPFTIAAIGLAFNVFMEPDGKGWRAFGTGWRGLLTGGTTALIVGGLFTMNGWDYPTYLGLLLISLVIQQWFAHQQRMCRAFLWHSLLLCGGMSALSYLFYLPFYLNFSSPAQGIGLVAPVLRSQLPDQLLIYGLFIFIFLSLLVVSALQRPLFARMAGSVSMQEQNLKASHESYFYDLPPRSPADNDSYSEEAATFFSQRPRSVALIEKEEERALPARMPSFPCLAGSAALWYWCGGILIYVLACLVVLAVMPKSLTFVLNSCLALSGFVLMLYHLRDRVRSFLLLLGTCAFALVAMCEMVYLKDDFANTLFERSNTVFKFYFQVWILLSIACAVGLFIIVDYLGTLQIQRRAVRWLKRSLVAGWSCGLALLILASMVYPLVAPYARYAQYGASGTAYVARTNSLDGLEYLRGTPDYDAIRWLNAHVQQGDPVIVEALGDDGSTSQRVSAFTGLPDIIGWVGHEHLWRANQLRSPAFLTDFSQRASALDTIYTSSSQLVVESLMRHYHATYIYVGPLEMQKYPEADMQRYSAYMDVTYHNQGVTIYQMRS